MSRPAAIAGAVAKAARWRGRTAIALLLVVALAGCATLGMMESIESLLAQGKELFQSGKYAEALAKFQAVIQRDPKQWEAYLYTARTYIAQKSWGPAIDNARKALGLAPTQGDVVPVLAQALLEGGRDSLTRGQYAEAGSRLKDYLGLHPTDGRAYVDLARAYLGSGSWTDALGTIQRGLGQAGDAGTRQDLLGALRDGGRQAIASGDLKGGIGLLQEYVTRDPSQVQALVDLGKAYWQSGQQGLALTTFRRVLELSPGQTDALRYLLNPPSR
ncbi:MAG TPA: tetratricopeptide repeat protein [Methylomirabilota bacterium]|jgi:tetratricopeptide (TPR) repeat protein